MTTIPNIFEFKSYAPIENILIIGCGGTGAYVISHLSRLLGILNKNNKKMGIENISLFLADGDMVESKNLGRQHFIISDVGKNKASALAERYSNAFGIEINVIPNDIEKLSDFSFLLKMKKNSASGDLVVGCVDNNASRKVINEWFCCDKNNDVDISWRPRFWIDCGNEEKSGQVICGYNPPARGSYGSYKLCPRTFTIDPAALLPAGEFSLPSVAEIYPEIMSGESKLNSELSCAERAISAPQNMQTNVTASTLALNYIQKIILGQGIKSHGVEFSIDNSFTTKFNTPDSFNVISTSRRRSWEK